MSHTATPPQTRLRPAMGEDLDVLVALETRCFDADAQSRRSLRHLLTKANACTLLAETDGVAAGYVCVLFRRGARAGRVYSIAVDPARRGAGVGRNLLAQAEHGARRRGCNRMRCELRVDNHVSGALFTGAGYRACARLRGYYPDVAGGRADGLRMEKCLEPPEALRG